MQTEILKVVVGSRAHKLNTDTSDYDYRGVYVVDTNTILSVISDYKDTSWIEGSVDDTSWEIGKFLKMAISTNPTVLETFLAPIAPKANPHPLGLKLRKIFPYIWSSTGVVDAFVNYGRNQRKKFLEDKDKRQNKYAVANLRVLYQGWELLETGTAFSVDMSSTPVYETLKKYRNGNYTIGEVVETCHTWEKKLMEAFRKNPNKEINLFMVNKFLLQVRKEFLK